MIDRGAKVTVTRQAELLDLSRSSVYYTPRALSNRELHLMRRIDELHLQMPFYGSRKLTCELQKEGHDVGRRHVVTLMRRMGIEAIYRKPRTSIPAREASIRPYLLGNLAINQPNQVWASDITYLPMADGFLYLMAILDVASRKVLAFRLSNTLTTDFCVEALEEAMSKFGRPQIFNTDQGSQFTSDEWIKVLDDAGVAISMDGKGRWIDNVFIERLWRFCAQGRYVTDCAGRSTRAGPAGEKKPHNDGGRAGKGRCRHGSRDDFDKVRPARLRIVESVERAGRKAIGNSASRAMMHYRTTWLDRYAGHLRSASRTSGLPRPSCEL